MAGEPGIDDLEPDRQGTIKLAYQPFDTRTGCLLRVHAAAGAENRPGSCRARAPPACRSQRPDGGRAWNPRSSSPASWSARVRGEHPSSMIGLRRVAPLSSVRKRASRHGGATSFARAGRVRRQRRHAGAATAKRGEAVMRSTGSAQRVRQREPGEGLRLRNLRARRSDRRDAPSPLRRSWRCIRQ